MKGHFKTAYLQREIPLDVICWDGGNSNVKRLEVGDVVTMVDGTFKDTDGVQKPCKIVTKKASGNPAVGDYIVAQSDMTLRSGAVGLKADDIYAYYYDDDVAVVQNATSAAEGESGTTSPDFFVGDNGYFYNLTANNANAANYDVVVVSTNSANNEYRLYTDKDINRKRGAKRGAFYRVNNVEDVWYD